MKRLVPTAWLAFHLAACASTPAPAPTAGVEAAPVERQAAQVCRSVDDPAAAGGLLAPAFLAQVPAARVEQILADLRRTAGSCSGVRTVRAGAWDGEFELAFTGGFVAPLRLAVEPAPGNRIVGIWFGAPAKAHGSLDEVVEELRTLPGRVSLLVADLLPDGIHPRAALHADEPLAVGSAFKLWVLAELARSIEAGERRWDDVVRLEAEAISFPAGDLRKWPVGSPLTLHTMAALMISRSDNTATDQLIRLLGREAIERTMAATGHATPARNQPFLTTREAFLLKEAAGDGYLATSDVAQRRAYLDAQVAKLERGEGPRLLAPTRIGEIEWFASARDLARTFAWLLDHGLREAGPLRGVLGIEAGIASAGDGRRWVGYKGGSETGVLNLSFLLENADGSWQVVIATWNDPAAPVDAVRFRGIVERALALAAEAPAPGEAGE